MVGVGALEGLAIDVTSVFPLAQGFPKVSGRFSGEMVLVFVGRGQEP